MPEDIPKAVAILLWLLIGFIVFGYLLMQHTVLIAVVFIVLFYGIPGYWLATGKKKGQ